ncbi:DUF4190 domain-containing protein [Rhodococcus sp. T2V]|uniref:DUF4190 domain-containing protein n=1 Tax=Rhodococcus sp. T2V TaxID=3034164 RepID=UPI0023E0EA52|nr:DUF4190 domain-containing protein [Rhodococcus sp. T2V]MDF3312338.1 DUF4190 domain-containing protein [Rhodococcus sp. T2V]
MTVDLSKAAATPSTNHAPINPYAVIALVAALLGLFPVAIVFGILAFWRPAGLAIAVAALILGILEALAAGTILYSAGTSLSDAVTNSSPATSYSLPSAQAQDLTPASAVPPALVPPAAATTEPEPEATTTVDEPEPATSPTVNGDCDPDVDNHATSADGTFLKCTYAGSTRPHWVRSVPIIGQAAEGQSCNPVATGIAISPEGQDLFCVSNGRTGTGTWAPGP